MLGRIISYRQKNNHVVILVLAELWRQKYNSTNGRRVLLLPWTILNVRRRLKTSFDLSRVRKTVLKELVATLLHDVVVPGSVKGSLRSDFRIDFCSTTYSGRGVLPYKSDGGPLRKISRTSFAPFTIDAKLVMNSTICWNVLTHHFLI